MKNNIFFFCVCMLTIMQLHCTDSLDKLIIPPEDILMGGNDDPLNFLNLEYEFVDLFRSTERGAKNRFKDEDTLQLIAFKLLPFRTSGSRSFQNSEDIIYPSRTSVSNLFYSGYNILASVENFGQKYTLDKSSYIINYALNPEDYPGGVALSVFIDVSDQPDQLNNNDLFYINGPPLNGVFRKTGGQVITVIEGDMGRDDIDASGISQARANAFRKNPSDNMYVQLFAKVQDIPDRLFAWEYSTLGMRKANMKINEQNSYPVVIWSAGLFRGDFLKDDINGDGQMNLADADQICANSENRPSYAAFGKVKALIGAVNGVKCTTFTPRAGCYTEDSNYIWDPDYGSGDFKFSSFIDYPIDTEISLIGSKNKDRVFVLNWSQVLDNREDILPNRLSDFIDTQDVNFAWAPNSQSQRAACRTYLASADRQFAPNTKSWTETHHAIDNDVVLKGAIYDFTEADGFDVSDPRYIRSCTEKAHLLCINFDPVSTE